MTEDMFFMKRALELAKAGEGSVNPNPLVGAVVVKDGTIIGEGFHERFGGPHAERNALAACGEMARGGVLYVTLEPCCHQGKTPPCTDAIVKSGIARVVVGSGDPNPLVAGAGIRILRQAGICVETGVLERECDALNRVFFHYIRTGEPYVTMKYAMTLDGKTATRSGKSKWITAAPARVRVHEDRNRHMAIMTGTGTILADDPMLNCRLPGGRAPVRLICDTGLCTPLSARVVATARQQPTWLLTCCREKDRMTAYENAGCRVLLLPQKQGHVDLQEAVRLVGKQGIDSIYLEGGSTLNASALEAGIVQALHCYIAPKLFGGTKAGVPIGGMGVELPREAALLEIETVKRYGEDILLECLVKKDTAAEGENMQQERRMDVYGNH